MKNRNRCNQHDYTSTIGVSSVLSRVSSTSHSSPLASLEYLKLSCNLWKILFLTASSSWKLPSENVEAKNIPLSPVQFISLRQPKTFSSFPREWIAHTWGSSLTLQETWKAGDVLLAFLSTPISKSKNRMGPFHSLKTKLSPLRIDLLALYIGGAVVVDFWLIFAKSSEKILSGVDATSLFLS